MSSNPSSSGNNQPAGNTGANAGTKLNAGAAAFVPGGKSAAKTFTPSQQASYQAQSMYYQQQQNYVMPQYSYPYQQMYDPNMMYQMQQMGMYYPQPMFTVPMTVGYVQPGGEVVYNPASVQQMMYGQYPAAVQPGEASAEAEVEAAPATQEESAQSASETEVVAEPEPTTTSASEAEVPMPAESAEPAVSEPVAVEPVTVTTTSVEKKVEALSIVPPEPISDVTVPETPSTAAAAALVTPKVNNGKITYAKSDIVLLFVKGSYTAPADIAKSYSEVPGGLREREPMGTFPSSSMRHSQSSGSMASHGSRDNLNRMGGGGRGGDRRNRRDRRDEEGEDGDYGQYGGDQSPYSPAPPAQYKPLFKLDETPEAVALRNANIILNKLSVTNFDKLSAEFMEIEWNSPAMMRKAVDMIVTKAQMEEVYCFMYADLCRAMTDKWNQAWEEFLAATGCTDEAAAVLTGGDGEEGVVAGNKKIKAQTRGDVFRVFLLDRCKSEFYVDRVAKLEEIRALTDISEEERAEKEIVLKKRYTGTMRFIGEVYMKDLVSAKIMVDCIDRLLQSTEEEELMCLSKLLVTIGAQLDQYFFEKKRKAKGNTAKYDVMNERFEQIAAISAQHPSSRIRFNMRDLLDMRSQNWRSRRQTDKVVDLSAPGGAGGGGGSVPPSPGPKGGAVQDEWETVAGKGGAKKGIASQPPAMAPVPGKILTKGPQDARSLPKTFSGRDLNLPPAAPASAKGARAGVSFTGERPTPRSGGRSPAPRGPRDSPSGRGRSDTFARSESPAAESPSPAPVSVDDSPVVAELPAGVEKKLRSVLDEFYHTGIVEEPLATVRELYAPGTMPEMVRVMIVHVCEQKDAVPALTTLLDRLYSNTDTKVAPALNKRHLSLAWVKFLDTFDDFEIDVPLAFGHSAQLFANMVEKQWMEVTFFNELPEGHMFVDCPKYSELILKIIGNLGAVWPADKTQAAFQPVADAVLSKIFPPPKQTKQEAVNELVAKFKIPFPTTM